ncbi:MAG: prenyltransferase/squalene oxidase repeat-containing protein [Deltaproteobacteria bacterium]
MAKGVRDIKKKGILIGIIASFMLIGIAVFTKGMADQANKKTQIFVSSKALDKASASKPVIKRTEIVPLSKTDEIQEKQFNNASIKENEEKVSNKNQVEVTRNQHKTNFFSAQKNNEINFRNTGNSIIRERTLNSMKLTGNYIKSYFLKNDFKGYLDWPAAAMYSIERSSEPDNYKKALDWKEKEIKEGNDFDAERATDYQRTIIGILSVGKNPKSFAGINFVEAVIKSQTASGKFADTIQGKGEKLLNSHIWGIISLYCAGERISNSERAYDWLISRQNSDGGFGIFTGAKSDMDMTGMALVGFSALGKNKNDKEVKKAVEFIKSRQSSSGGFEIFGQENPDTASAVVQGLVAIGIDPTSEEWIKEKDKNMIDFIISFQLSDGSFSHIRGGEADMMATTRALTALADYYNLKSVYQVIRESSAGK